MGTHTGTLTALGAELFIGDEWRALSRIAGTVRLDREALAEFDDSLAGPSMRRLNDPHQGGGTLAIVGYGLGRYDREDRTVFRPLHYCGAYLNNPNLESLTRSVVAMGGAHLESLVKRVGGLHRVPLGRAITEKCVRQRLDSAARDRLSRYAGVNNDAKHGFEDAHMFSVADVVLAYVVTRRLAYPMYPLAHLATDWVGRRVSTPADGPAARRTL